MAFKIGFSVDTGEKKPVDLRLLLQLQLQAQIRCNAATEGNTCANREELYG